MEEQQRRQQQLQEEISTEIDLNAKLEFDIQTYSSTIANKPQIEDTDKVVLPQEILEEISKRKLKTKIVFINVFFSPKKTCYASHF